MMEEYPRNSRVKREKEEPKDLEKVVEGVVIRRKKPLSRRIKAFFFGHDAKGTVISVWFDVIIPGIKDIVWDAAEEGLKARLFGDSRYGGGSSRRHRGRHSYDSPRHVSYEKRYSQNTPRDSRRDDPREISRRGRADFDFQEVILSSRAEAEEVLDQLYEQIDKFETASVSQLYKLIDVVPKFTDERWGWIDLTGSSVVRVRGGERGYLLNLPKPEPIDY